MLPDEPTDEEREEELPEDNGTPFRPADDQAGTGNNANDLPVGSARPPLDDTHPSTDTNIQREEAYDEGISGAAEAEDPASTAGPAASPLDPVDEDDIDGAL